MKKANFITDEDKMADFHNVDKAEILYTYSYLTEEEYDNTAELVKLWEDLGDTPIDDEECIDIDFRDFPKGTHREEIWLWIEETYAVSVAFMMSGKWRAA